MIFFITVLRAIATLFITNSHFTHVYPISIFASGGMLGDVIFFAVSGFCLYNIKEKNFFKWFLKRISRIYPAVIIITAVYMLIGFYEVPGTFGEWVRRFIYPTYYHFIGSIILLYIPFYFAARYFKKNWNLLMVGLLALYVILYLFVFDSSFYHIDVVELRPEGWQGIFFPARFMFFGAMLMGGYFRENLDKFRNQKHWYDWVIMVILLFGYFGSKVAFSRIPSLSRLQILNQAVLFALVYFILRCFAGIDQTLENLPKNIQTGIRYLAAITLELYIVQVQIIVHINDAFPFPANWYVIVATIFATTSLLHLVVSWVNKPIKKLLK